MTTVKIILIITTIAVGLIAGLFYAYSCSVNRGLGKLDDVSYLSAMQSINREIINPIFMMSFMGSLLLLPVASYFTYKTGSSAIFYLVLSATVIYAVGTFGVTMGGNVPLNNGLDKFRIEGASTSDLANQRLLFEKPWNRLNLIRTLASFSSLVLMVIACVQYGSTEK